MNLCSDHKLGQADPQMRPGNKSYWRNAWLLEQDDIIISPVPIENGFLDYICASLNIDRESIAVLVDPAVIDESLSPAFFKERLCTLRRQRPPSSLFSCFATNYAVQLSDQLGLVRGEGERFAGQSGAELLNRKSHFRQFAIGLQIPVPEGSVVRDEAVLLRTIEEYFLLTEVVIVKSDNAAGGVGNIALVRDFPRAFPGVRETLSFENDKAQVCSYVWRTLTDVSSHAVVVECYHLARHRFYVELHVGDANVRLLNTGTIRLDESDKNNEGAMHWVGLDLPAHVPRQLLDTSIGHSIRFAEFAKGLGYRGLINIDAIVTSEGRLFFNESNARWGGGTVLDSLGRRLLGDDYVDKFFLSSVRDIRSPCRTRAEQLIRQETLHFSELTKCGALILACGESEEGTMECLIVAPSRERARVIERKIRGVLTPSLLSRNNKHQERN
jgi:hypothetical protein